MTNDHQIKKERRHLGSWIVSRPLLVIQNGNEGENISEWEEQSENKKQNNKKLFRCGVHRINI